MKLRVLKVYKCFLAFVLSIVGVGLGSCSKDSNNTDPGGGVAMYGMPLTTYQVSGFAANDNLNPVENIRVTLSEGTGYNWGDTNYTNKLGIYLLEYAALGNDTLLVSFKDTTGIYQDLDTLISFSDVSSIGADGSWDMGTKAKVLNVRLKKE